MIGGTFMSEWRYVKPLVNEGLISETEKQLGITFDKSYKEFVEKYNGGRPPVGSFETDKTKGRTIKSFLSLNPTDTENIIKSNSYISEFGDKVVAFGIDNFGNYICFTKSDNSVVFFDFETGEIERVTDSFSGFLKIVQAL